MGKIRHHPQKAKCEALSTPFLLPLFLLSCFINLFSLRSPLFSQLCTITHVKGNFFSKSLFSCNRWATFHSFKYIFNLVSSFQQRLTKFVAVNFFKASALHLPGPVTEPFHYNGSTSKEQNTSKVGNSSSPSSCTVLSTPKISVPGRWEGEGWVALRRVSTRLSSSVHCLSPFAVSSFQEGAHGYFGVDGAKVCSLSLVVWLSLVVAVSRRQNALLAEPEHYIKQTLKCLCLLKEFKVVASGLEYIWSCYRE